MNLIRWLYEPKRLEALFKGDLIVPLDYGSLKEDSEKLPRATIKCLSLAKKAMEAGVASRIAWACTDIPPVPGLMLEAWKRRFFGSQPSHGDEMIPCKNTITEAERILKMFPRTESVTIVCDWRHAPRALKIWKAFFKGPIQVLTIDGEWDEDHASRWCRSNGIFLIANFFHHALLSIFGIERLRKVTHE